MYANNIEQLISFFYFMAVGTILSIIFDIFRVSRRAFKTSDIVTNIEDIVFGITTGIIIILSIFLFNNGELRLYIFIGLTIGIIIYMLFISKYFININLKIITLIKNIINIIIKPIIFIIKFFKKILIKPISFIFINIKSLFNNIFNIYKKKIKIYKKENKQEGF